MIPGPSYEPVTTERRGDWEEIRRLRIADGQCPMPACGEPLDEGACPRCGWSLLEEKLRRSTVEDRPDYLPTLPAALMLDEYAPAAVEEDAA